MIKEHYPFSAFYNTLYTFESIGIQGIIKKLVIFYQLEGNQYNLGFGDILGENISDQIISNNQDLVKVISTVVKILYHFFHKHPEALIIIKGVDEKRSNLYNAILKRRYHEVKAIFDIKGRNKEELEPYNPQKKYEEFEIQIKDFSAFITFLEQQN